MNTMWLFRVDHVNAMWLVG